MHPHTIITATLSFLAATTTARIYGIAVPRTIAPGSTFPITIETIDYIQRIEDVAMAFGIAPIPTEAHVTLGTILLAPKFLGANYSNIITNITHEVTVPKDVPSGPAAFNGALFSLGGVYNSPSVEEFSVNVTIGRATSMELVSSETYPVAPK